MVPGAAIAMSASPCEPAPICARWSAVTTAKELLDDLLWRAGPSSRVAKLIAPPRRRRNRNSICSGRLDIFPCKRVIAKGSFASDERPPRLELVGSVPLHPAAAAPDAA